MALSMIKGLGLGAGLMYFLDPDVGRRRRALARDQFVNLIDSMDDLIRAGTRDLGNRAEGLFAEMGHMLGGEEVSDEVLVERVRAQLGRLVSHPHAIKVEARRGRVTLRGPILADEVDRLLSGVASVRGVSGVDDQLDVHKQAGNIPSLQGGRVRSEPGWDQSFENWSPSAKLVAGVVGASLAFRVVRHGGLAGLAVLALGAGLAAQGLGLVDFASQEDGGWDRSGEQSGSTSFRESPSRRESGQPGGGQGRIDDVGRTGVYPASGPMPAGAADVRTPETFVRGQVDEQGRQVEGGSEPSMMGGAVLGGATPPSSSPPEG